MTQEVEVACAAETHFKLSYENLPSGLRKGFDRIGLVNLGKGHADISTGGVTKKELEELSPGKPIPILSYKVDIPYAEMKINFGIKKAIVSAVGKRCVLVGVPNFLDPVLEPWMEKLHAAALGRRDLEDALKPRVMKELLALVLAHSASEKRVRRDYPFGLSPGAIEKLIADMRLAVKYATLKIRSIVSAACIAGAGIFYHAFYGMGLEARLTHGSNYAEALGIDLMILAIVMALGWGALNFSVRAALRKRFPQMPHAFQQDVGMAGGLMAVGIVSVFLIFLSLANVKPLWYMEMFMK